MYKLSINKDLFENILLKKIVVLEKENSNFWKNELFNPILKNDKFSYEIKQFKKLLLTNGLGKTKPKLMIECLKVDYSEEKGIFEFHLGEILEKENIGIDEENKNEIIEQLPEKKKKTKEKVKMVQQKIIF